MIHTKVTRHKLKSMNGIEVLLVWSTPSRGRSDPVPRHSSERRCRQISSRHIVWGGGPETLAPGEGEEKKEEDRCSGHPGGNKNKNIWALYGLYTQSVPYAKYVVNSVMLML